MLAEDTEIVRPKKHESALMLLILAPYFTTGKSNLEGRCTSTPQVAVPSSFEVWGYAALELQFLAQVQKMNALTQTATLIQPPEMVAMVLL